MPIFHTQYSGQRTAPDGNSISLPPSVVLQTRGPVVQVTVGVADVVAHQLAAAGQNVPQPIAGQALIDTGASVTCIDDQIAQQLQLPVIDVAQMTSASHAAIPVNIYPAVIEFVGFGMRLNIGRAMGANLAPQGIVALLGRDLLQVCTLHYNGPTGQITLAV